MSNHSIIEHRANYHFIKGEEDYLAICSFGEHSPHCKSMILANLEHWMTVKRDADQGEWVYLTLPEWIEQTYEWYARNVIIDCLKELLSEGLIERRAIKRYDQDTFEYKLNIEAVQGRIRALPEKAPKEIKPNLEAYHAFTQKKKEQNEARRKEREEGSLKINDRVVEKSTALKNQRVVVEKSTAARSKGSLKKDYQQLKNQRNIDTSIDTSLTSSSEIHLSSSAIASDDAVAIPDKDVKNKNELTPEQKIRARALKAKIEARCGPLTNKGPNIAENTAIAKLMQKYSDVDIEDELHYLEHCHFKWSKPDFKFKIRGNVLLDEMESVLRTFAEKPNLRALSTAQKSAPAGRQISSFDDPNYDMSSEFYPSDAEKKARKQHAAC